MGRREGMGNMKIVSVGVNAYSSIGDLLITLKRGSYAETSPGRRRAEGHWQIDEAADTKTESFLRPGCFGVN